MQLIKRPLLTSFLLTILWLITRRLGSVDQLSLIKADETILTSGFITALTVFVALISAAVFQKVWSEWGDVRNSILDHDEKAFNKYADERVPTTVKAALFILFLALLGAFFILQISSVIVGIYIVSSMVFAISFYWEVIMDLDDYWTGAWNIDINLVPDEWEWAREHKAEIIAKLGTTNKR